MAGTQGCIRAVLDVDILTVFRGSQAYRQSLEIFPGISLYQVREYFEMPHHSINGRRFARDHGAYAALKY
jgi:hypothetical protein